MTSPRLSGYELHNGMPVPVRNGAPIQIAEPILTHEEFAQVQTALDGCSGRTISSGCEQMLWRDRTEFSGLDLVAEVTMNRGHYVPLALALIDPPEHAGHLNDGRAEAHDEPRTAHGYALGGVEPSPPARRHTPTGAASVPATDRLHTVEGKGSRSMLLPHCTVDRADEIPVPRRTGR